MRIIVADDEKLILEGNTALVRKILPDAEIIMCNRPAKVLEEMEACLADIAILDINMPGMKGVDLARRCMEMNPNINIIFVTGYSEYALEAYRLHASGYLMKPISETVLREELSNLRIPVFSSNSNSSEKEEEQEAAVGDAMSLKACYEAFGGDYYDALNRLINKDMIDRFLIKFVKDKSFFKITMALSVGDAEDALKACQTLKGICLNLSLNSLAESVNILMDNLHDGQVNSDTSPLFVILRKNYDLTRETIERYARENRLQLN